MLLTVILCIALIIAADNAGILRSTVGVGATVAILIAMLLPFVPGYQALIADGLGWAMLTIVWGAATLGYRQLFRAQPINVGRWAALWQLGWLRIGFVMEVEPC
jgi:uncharacterized membrane protein